MGTDLLEFATQFGEWNVAEKVAVRLLEERPENSSFLANLGGIYEETEQCRRCTVRYTTPEKARATVPEISAFCAEGEPDAQKT